MEYYNGLTVDRNGSLSEKTVRNMVIILKSYMKESSVCETFSVSREITGLL